MNRQPALLLSHPGSSRRKLNRALYSAGFAVEHRPVLEPKISSSDQRFALILVDCCQEFQSDCVLEPLLELIPPERTLFLVGEPEGHWADYLERGAVHHIVGRVPWGERDDGLDEGEVIATCSKILSGAPFGISAYIDETRTPVESIALQHTDDRHSARERVRAFAEALQCGTMLRESIITAADELMTNAIFNAPHDDGRARHRDRARSSSFALREDEVATLSFACDGQTLFLSVAEQFGSIDPKLLISYLRPVLDARQAQMRAQGRGAGLGLVTVFAFCDRLILNLEPAIRCEIIAAFDLRHRGRRGGARIRSLNLFEVGSRQ